MTAAKSPILIFLFHRDLRIVDHTGLRVAIEEARRLGARILPLFIFTKTQITNNPLKSIPAVQFMIDSLEDLAAEIDADGGTLRFAYGDTTEILKGIKNLVGVIETRDYTPYAKQREQEIEEMCKERGILYRSVEDIYLTNPGTIKTGAGKTFQKFTPFWETARRHLVPKPVAKPREIPWLTTSPRIPHSTSLKEMRKGAARMTQIQPGGRLEGLKNLAVAAKQSKPYADRHDMMAEPTSQLSAHNHFGTVSIREVYWAISDEDFRRQLYWRDFYGHIMANFEGLYGVGPYEFQAPSGWKKGEKEVFEAWAHGKTGIPLIDAAMRQMLVTGFMHNRARMLVASWLVKDRGVHWRWGERWFAQHLVDYDPAQNMMNWIWIASVLPFASAPFRRHDPDRYAARFDADGVYRETWL